MSYRNDYGIEPMSAEQARYVAHADVNMLTRQHWRDDTGRLKAFVDSLGPSLPVLAEVAAERTRQDAKWGGPAHDDEHVTADWESYIHARVACERPSRPQTFRERMLQIAALAVAAIESHDRKTAVAESPEAGGGLTGVTPDREPESDSLSALRRIRARLTTLSLAANLPPMVWSEICHLNTEMAQVIKTMTPVPDVWGDVADEISRAHAKHGRSVEDGTDSDRARILLCEAVEVSQAVDDLSRAELVAEYISKGGTTADVENYRDHRAALRAALRAEVVQVAAVAMRWLMTGGGK